MKTILVVDDDKLNLSAARKVLSGEYKVIPVVRGTQALSYLENEECDMILLDSETIWANAFFVIFVVPSAIVIVREPQFANASSSTNTFLGIVMFLVYFRFSLSEYPYSPASKACEEIRLHFAGIVIFIPPV